MRFIVFFILLQGFCYGQFSLTQECQKYITITDIEFMKKPENGLESLPDTIKQIWRKLPREGGGHKRLLDSIFQDILAWQRLEEKVPIPMYPQESFRHPYDFYFNNVYVKSLRGYLQLESDWVSVDTSVFLTSREKLFLYEDRYMYFQSKYWDEKFKLTILDMTTCECAEAVLESNHHKIYLLYHDEWKVRYEDYYQLLKK